MRRPLDLSVGGRLALAFGAVAAVLALLAVTSLVFLEHIAFHTRQHTREIAPRVQAAQRLESEILYLGIAERAYVIWGDDARLKAFKDTDGQLRDALATAVALPKGPEDAAVFEPIPALTEAFRSSAAARVAMPNDSREASEENAAVAVSRESVLGRLREWSALQARESAEIIAHVTNLQEWTRWALLATVAIVMAVFALAALFTWRSVRMPALALAEAARRVAGGDYAFGAAMASVPSRDGRPHRDELAALAEAFGRMSEAVREREQRLASQNEELQAQNEEIQAQNEEAQNQNEELAAQAEELAAQADELRQATEVAERSEREFRLLFDNLSEAFALHEILYGPDGSAVDYRFLEVNPAFERITGLGREQTVGRTVKEVLPGIERDWIDRYAAVAGSGEPVRFTSFAAALGKHFQVVAFRSAPGQFATLFVDDTDRWRAANALADADRRKDDFLAVLSHELRNPLAPIQNALQLLESEGDRECDPERSRRARRVIARQAGQLARLVEDLLDVTRVTRGKIQLRREHVDLGAVVSQAAEDFASILEAAGVHLEVRAAAGRLFADADPARLAQIVGNLLQNAAKFTPSGGHVTLSVDESAPGRAAVRVRDTGVGISRDVLEHLFEPFTQAERSLARTRGGLGLGLALVKGLAELHGGNVRAESDGEDRGAEFTVEIPLTEEGPSEERARPPVIAGRRILLIEDNVDGAETLRDVLALAGHSVELAFDGASGLARARELRPDAVLCDVGLPDLDGYEIARRMRADPVLEQTFIVALTGYALPDDQRRAAEAGFDAHLAKPATLDAIQELLASASLREAARS